MNITKVYSAGIFAAAALLVSGCFNPDLTGVEFTCDVSTSPQCPAGLSCVDGNCAVPLPPLMIIAPTAPSTTGCALGGGVDISKSGKSAWACAGIFEGRKDDSTRNINRLCAAGYSLCTNADAIDLSKCDKDAPGFYMSRVFSVHNNKNDKSAQCAAQGTNTFFPGWAGCGAAQTNSLPLPTKCSGFARTWDCQIDRMLACDDGGFPLTPEGAQNERADYGALCCK